MTDGSALLLTMLYGARNAGLWTTERGTNLLDGGAPFYDVYATSDELAVAVGCLEEQFYAELLRVLELDGAELGDYRDPASWPGIRATLRETFARRTRAEWEGLRAPRRASRPCSTSTRRRATRTTARERRSTTPATAPSRAGAPLRANASCAPGRAAPPGADTEPALAAWGFSQEEIRALFATGVAHGRRPPPTACAR